jgi:hypothetical protein
VGVVVAGRRGAGGQSRKEGGGEGNESQCHCRSSGMPSVDARWPARGVTGTLGRGTHAALSSSVRWVVDDNVEALTSSRHAHQRLSSPLDVLPNPSGPVSNRMILGDLLATEDLSDTGGSVGRERVGCRSMTSLPTDLPQFLFDFVCERRLSLTYESLVSRKDEMRGWDSPLARLSFARCDKVPSESSKPRETPHSLWHGVVRIRCTALAAPMDLGQSTALSVPCSTDTLSPFEAHPISIRT